MDLNEIEAYCSFDDGRVYVLLAMARAKENPEMDSTPVIRKIVREKSELRRKIAELDHAVERFPETYRLYLTANPRDTTKALFRLRGRTDDWLESRLHGDEEIVRKFGRVDSEFKSILQQDACKAETNFVFDVDELSDGDVTEVLEALRAETDVQLVRETPNGFHIVTAPFDYTGFDHDAVDECKTDGLLFLSLLDD
jgi:hypothetical protein